jgi:hypothetical protein
VNKPFFPLLAADPIPPPHFSFLLLFVLFSDAISPPSLLATTLLRLDSTAGTLAMAFWWPLMVLAAAYALCRLLLLLIPPTVPSIDVDASDGTAPFPPPFRF